MKKDNKYSGGPMATDKYAKFSGRVLIRVAFVVVLVASFVLLVINL